MTKKGKKEGIEINTMEFLTIKLDFFEEIFTMQKRTSLIQTAKLQILDILDQMKKDIFDFQNFSFEKQRRSGLTNLAGLYCILNKKEKKVYLGGTSDLAQRKGEHNLSRKGKKKWPTELRKAVESGSPDDFYFVPIVPLPFFSIAL